jgi:phosphoglycerol transferase MdoB-like AlkP superfamily enzyme
LFTPLRSVIAEALAVAGVFGLATRACARFAPWKGSRRYLALAIVVPLALGVVMLGAGAAELAWIWLVPAAALALAPRLGRFAPLALALALLPCVLLLRENQLVEAAFNGFLPSGVPLVAWIATLGIPSLAGVGWWARTHQTTGPLVTLILPMGCGLSAVLGLTVLGSTPIACSAAKFEQFPAACARASIWP